jgi:hypothetical protein
MDPMVSLQSDDLKLVNDTGVGLIAEGGCNCVRTFSNFFEGWRWILGAGGLDRMV